MLDQLRPDGRLAAAEPFREAKSGVGESMNADIGTSVDQTLSKR